VDVNGKIIGYPLPPYLKAYHCHPHLIFFFLLSSVRVCSSSYFSHRRPFVSVPAISKTCDLVPPRHVSASCVLRLPVQHLGTCLGFGILRPLLIFLSSTDLIRSVVSFSIRYSSLCFIRPSCALEKGRRSVGLLVVASLILIPFAYNIIACLPSSFCLMPPGFSSSSNKVQFSFVFPYFKFECCFFVSFPHSYLKHQK